MVINKNTEKNIDMAEEKVENEKEEEYKLTIQDFIKKNLLAIEFVEEQEHSTVEILKKCIKNDFKISYGFLQIAMTDLESAGFVSIDKEGREARVKLTEKGKQLKNLILQIEKLFV